MATILEEFKVTIDTAEAKKSVDGLQATVGKLDNQLSKGAKALNLMDGAASQMGGKIAEASAKLVNFGSMIAYGGPVGIAVAAFTAAIAGTVYVYNQLGKATEEATKSLQFFTERTRLVAVDYEKIAMDLEEKVANHGRTTTEILVADLQGKTFAALDQIRILQESLDRGGLSDEEAGNRSQQLINLYTQLESLKRARNAAEKIGKQEAADKRPKGEVDFSQAFGAGTEWAEKSTAEEQRILAHNYDEKRKAEELFQQGITEIHMANLARRAELLDKAQAEEEAKHKVLIDGIMGTGMVAMNMFSQTLADSITAWADGTEQSLGRALRGFLKALGGMLIAKGTADVLMGTANVLIPGLQGPGAALIAAGGAEIALGTGLVAANRGQGASVGASRGGAYSGGGGYIGNQYGGQQNNSGGGPIIINISGAMSSAEAGKEVAMALKAAHSMGYS